MWTKIAEGEGLTSLKTLPAHEGEVSEGANCKLVLGLKSSVPQGSVSGLEDILRLQGISDISINSLGSQITVQYRKKFPWLAVIVAAILASLALAILIVGWQFFQDTASVVPAPIIAIGAVVFIALIIFIMWKTRGLSVGGIK